MPRRLGARFLPVVLGVALAPALAAGDDVQPGPIDVALGIKTGVIPPVFAVPELVVHGPHFFAGAFGIYTGGGIGNGGRRFTLGGELAYEFNPPGKGTPYLAGSFFHYEALTDARGFYERSDLLTVTAGYEWKTKHFELQLGGGALFLLADEVPPCTGFCLDFSGLEPRVLPTFDLAARYRF